MSKLRRSDGHQLRDEILAFLGRDTEGSEGRVRARVFGNEPELACPLLWAREANAFDCVGLEFWCYCDMGHGIYSHRLF